MAPELITYLLKLSLSLAVVFLFYQLVLQRLTFYAWNRWYFISFTVLAFLIPLVDISVLWASHPEAPVPAMTYYIPQLEAFGQADKVRTLPNFSMWEGLFLVLLMGMGGLLLRTGIRILSFLQIKKKARLLSGRGIKIYQVDADIQPFSFGRSVFLNPTLHREQDLPEIMRHELVHVQQGHTADILWIELVCILNWYNPFAWLLRRQVRENLEFIADRQVLQTGIDKKHYQYLLLQVTGGPAFSLANPFNFSPLKKRIMMMNKMPSTRYKLAWFLVLLPLVSVLLLAFRGADKPAQPQGKVFDVSSQAGKEAFTKYNYSIPSEIRPSVPAQQRMKGLAQVQKPDPFQLFMQRNPQVKGLQWKQEDEVIILLKSGGKESFNLKDKASMAVLEQKYGKLPPPPPPPPAPPVPKMVPPPPPVPAPGKKLPAEEPLPVPPPAPAVPGKPAPPPAPAVPEKPAPPSLGNQGRSWQTNYFTYLA